MDNKESSTRISTTTLLKDSGSTLERIDLLSLLTMDVLLILISILARVLSERAKISHTPMMFSTLIRDLA